MKRRVVITGMGMVSPLGMNKESFWNSIKEGKSAIKTVDKFDTSEFTTKVAAQLDDFNVTEYIDKKEARRMDLYSQYALSAATIAIEDSKLNLDSIDKNRFGSIVGSGIGGIQTFEDQHTVLMKKGGSRISPFFIPMMIANMAAGLIAIKFGAKGFSECVITACATSSNALGDAFKVIQRGDADIMISGGAEAPITPMAFGGFCSMKATSTNPDPKTACRHFDINRDGFVMGEGAGVLILEDLEHALNRGAEIIAEIVGYGCTNDAYHMTAPAPDGEGAVRSMAMAINDANVKNEEVGYINAHGTSTPYNDKFETMAIKTLFGEYSKKLPVSSTKSMTGHLLGATGAIEGIICSLALRDGFLPPTIAYKDIDPECDLDYVVNKGRNADIKYALSNSLGFGGHNASIVFKKFES